MRKTVLVILVLFVILIVIGMYKINSISGKILEKSPSNNAFSANYDEVRDPKLQTILIVKKDDEVNTPNKMQGSSFNPVLVAPYVDSALPRIDGNVTLIEISDANLYEYSTSNINAKVYVKSISKSECTKIKCILKEYIYKAYIFEASSITPQTYWWMDLFFDEGNDNFYGSGSFDNVLTPHQEDWKYFTVNGVGTACTNLFGYTEGCQEPQCQPWLNNSCWQCRDEDNLDNNNAWTGYTCRHTPSGWVVPSIFGRRSDVLDGNRIISDTGVPGWMSFSEFHSMNMVHYLARSMTEQGKISIELLIPYKGFDGDQSQVPQGGDESDINSTRIDTLGFLLNFRFSGGGNQIIIPSDGIDNNPSTYARLQLQDS